MLWPDFDLRWRYDMHPELPAFQGQVLQDVELLEWTGSDIAQRTVAVSFRFLCSRLTIANALDENGLAFGPPESRYRRHSLRHSTRPETGRNCQTL